MGQYLKLFNTHTNYQNFVNSGEMMKPNVSHCIQETHVHYNSLPDNNGYQFVDLGLPSGNLWAVKNIGAQNISDPGLFFAWGETEGFDLQSRTFDWNNYKWGVYNNSASNYGMTKYNATDGTFVLSPEDDAAHINMGGDWVIPSSEDFQELANNSTLTSTDSDYIFEANGNTLIMTKSNNNNYWVNKCYYDNWTTNQYYRAQAYPSGTPNRCNGYMIRGVLKGGNHNFDIATMNGVASKSFYVFNWRTNGANLETDITIVLTKRIDKNSNVVINLSNSCSENTIYTNTATSTDGITWTTTISRPLGSCWSTTNSNNILRMNIDNGKFIRTHYTIGNQVAT